MLTHYQPTIKHETEMKTYIKILPQILLAASLMASPLSAQDAGQSDIGNGLSTGVPVGAEKAADSPYVREKHGAWDIRCLKTGEETETCQMYQLLKDDEGNSVAEITLFALPEGQEALAGATIVTPLETLLTAQMTLSVDGQNGKRYPFSYC
ncbi:MAG: invasion associated locus B family protein, partial [Marinosulfonomonas sp.]|nr:invasion associated locus B family protein [Marinosulfonomonas sp.]